jgi:enoyl-CoA hydratase
MSDTIDEVITIESDGPVRILRMNRAEHYNAVNSDLHIRLGTIWAEVAADPDARAVVLTGNGPTFSAGGDYDFMMQIEKDPAIRWKIMEEARRIIYEILRFPLPLISAVNGPAVGLGASLAMMSDLVVMSEEAHLADPHVAVGLVAGDGGAAAWPTNTSMLLAKEFLFLGDPVPADRAYAIGLANRVVPKGDVVSTSVELAQRLSKLPQHALRDTKRALNLGIEQNMAATRDFALVAQRFSLGDEDHLKFLAGQAAKRNKS